MQGKAAERTRRLIQQRQITTADLNNVTKRNNKTVDDNRNRKRLFNNNKTAAHTKKQTLQLDNHKDMKN